MSRIILLLVSLLSFSHAQAQELEPFINFLRSTPAFVNGQIAFSADSVLYQEGWSIVKMMKNQEIEFSFKENWLQVRPGNSFYVKYAGFRVYIDSVTWTPHGVKTESHMGADFTGLSKGYVSSGVADVIEGIFGEKLKKANGVLSTVRNQRTIGNIFDKAVSIVHIFTSGEGATLSLPTYRGEIGLNFLPPTPKAFNMYGVRVAIKGNDHYRSGFSFTGNTQGIYPNRIQFTSRDGTDVNSGKEFKAMARLVLSEATLDTRGIDLKLHLGASEPVTDMLTLVELAARARGEVVHCERCEEAAQFPMIRIKVERFIRTSMMEQVKAFWSYLPGLNVSQNVMNAFLRREKCREDNLACLAKAGRETGPVRACTQIYVQCMK